jgi:hypothetical protein
MMALETFSIKYNRAHSSSIEFKTEIDGEYTAHEQRACLQTNERNSWTLEFEKTPTTFEAMRSFFIARKGRFRAFNWQWKRLDSNGRNIGGNDQWYIVRFDTDKLDFKIDQLGYKTFTVPIVQVMTGE